MQQRRLSVVALPFQSAAGRFDMVTKTWDPQPNDPNGGSSTTYAVLPGGDMTLTVRTDGTQRLYALVCGCLCVLVGCVCASRLGDVRVYVCVLCVIDCTCARAGG